MEGLSNIDVSEFIRLAPIGSPETGQEVRPGTSLPRAGGQDDVSLNKLPQITYGSWRPLDVTKTMSEDVQTVSTVENLILKTLLF